MDSEVVHSQVEENDEYQPNNGGPQPDHEKKSVLNKVKAKAKKIKDTIKKHGQQVLDHGRESSSNEDQNSPHDHHDIDEDEKLGQDHQQAPINESEDVKSVPPTLEQVENFVKIATPASEQVENLDELGVNSGGTIVKGEEHHQEPRVVGASSPTSTETNEKIGTTELHGRTFGEEEKAGHLERSTGFDDDDSRMQGSRPDETSSPPPPSYEANKATDDPTGTAHENVDAKSVPPTFEQVEKFVEVATPASEQVENLNELGVNHGGTTTTVTGEEEPYQEPRVVGASPTSETDENTATEPTITFAGEEKKQPGQGEVNLERPTGFDEDQHMLWRGPEAYPPLNHQTKFSDPTGTDASLEKYLERMNVQDDPKPVPLPKFLPDSAKTQYPPAESHDQNSPKLSSATETQYPSERNIGQLVPEISTATETQHNSGETHDKFASDTISTSIDSNKESPEVTEQTFDSATAAVEEQPSYDSVENASNQKSYTNEISSTTSVIADKAVSAENAVDSELDYDEKGDRDNKVKSFEEEKSTEDASNKSGSTLDYGKNIASTLTEKLAPVYGKVAEVGSAVKSKVSGTRTSDSVGVEAENVSKEQNKGVSVKDYLAEKLKPGEEDKALSEVISETLYKRKEEPTKAYEDEDRDVSKVDSDAIKKQEMEAVEKEHGQSETVSEENYENSSGKSVVGKIKGVVGSWFGKSDENQSSSHVAGGEDLLKNKSTGVEVEQAEGERRLHE